MFPEILPVREFVKGKCTIGTTEYDISYAFDPIYKTWVQELFLMIQKISDNQTRFNFYMLQFGIDIQKEQEYSFLFTSMSTLTQPLYFLIKDELISSLSNFNLKDYYDYVTENQTELKKEFLFEYLEKTVRFEFNGLLSSLFYDTFIGLWYCFESAIINITKKYENGIKQELLNSNFKKYKKTVKKAFASNTEELVSPNKLDDILGTQKEKYDNTNPAYISFPDRINYLFNVIESDYSRDIKKDKDVLLFLAAKRNTMHNNGRHIKKDLSIEIGGRTLILKENMFGYSKDLIDDFKVCFMELMDIYCEILCYVSSQKLSNEPSGDINSEGSRRDEEP